LDLAENGRIDVLVYRWFDNVFAEENVARIPYLWNVCGFGVDTILIRGEGQHRESKLQKRTMYLSISAASDHHFH